MSVSLSPPKSGERSAAGGERGLGAIASSGAKRQGSHPVVLFSFRSKLEVVSNPTTLKRARELRANRTESEGRLWSELRGRRLGGWKWRRQAPIGPFIVDFYCPAAKLVVELDGSQHLDQADYDARRTRFLESGGLRVIRFGSENIWGGGLDFVCQSILEACGRAGGGAGG
jgi:very-short-patch-repair endonuclease